MICKYSNENAQLRYGSGKCSAFIKILNTYIRFVYSGVLHGDRSYMTCVITYVQRDVRVRHVLYSKFCLKSLIMTDMYDVQLETAFSINFNEFLIIITVV